MANDGVDMGRRKFLTATTWVVGGAGIVLAAIPFIQSWQPSARAKTAGAPVEVDIGKLETGQMIISEWRGQPIWIIHRSQAFTYTSPHMQLCFELTLGIMCIHFTLFPFLFFIYMTTTGCSS